MARAVATMIALLSSFVVVALAEMGDKTQLIALILGLRYRRPWIVMTGILIATVCNHALAPAVVWGAARFDRQVLELVLGVSFIAFGLWTLVPDRAAAAAESHYWGPLVSTTLVFFFAEMGGDKTQLATLARRTFRIARARHGWHDGWHACR